jgi:hypothetical protein
VQLFDFLSLLRFNVDASKSGASFLHVTTVMCCWKAVKRNLQLANLLSKKAHNTSLACLTLGSQANEEIFVLCAAKKATRLHLQLLPYPILTLVDQRTKHLLYFGGSAS